VTQAHILPHFLTCYGSFGRNDAIDQTLTAANKLNLKIIVPDAPRAVAGRPDDSIQPLDRPL
jgi:hypothetical protein